jgi:hypothetical protein
VLLDVVCGVRPFASGFAGCDLLFSASSPSPLFAIIGVEIVYVGATARVL